MFSSFKGEKGKEKYFQGNLLERAKLLEFGQQIFSMEDFLPHVHSKREVLYKDFLINAEKWNKGLSLNYLPGWAGVLLSYNKEVCLGMENIALRSERLNEFIGKSAMIMYLGEKLNNVIESEVKDIDEYKNILSELKVQEEMILKERAYNEIEYPKPVAPAGAQASLGYDESLMDRFLTFTYPLSSKISFEKSGKPNFTQLFRPYWEPEDSLKSLLDKFVFKNLSEFLHMDRPFKKWKYSKLNYNKWIDIWSKEILERMVERGIPKEENSEENILLKTYTDILDCFIDYSGYKEKHTPFLNKVEAILEENFVVNRASFDDLEENFSEWSLELASSLEELIMGSDVDLLENSYFNKRGIRVEKSFNEVNENVIYEFKALPEKVIGFKKLRSLNETVKHLFDYFYNHKETLYLTRDWEGGYSDSLNKYANIGETEAEELLRYLYESNNKEENIFETLYEGSHQTNWDFIWLWPQLNEFYLKRGWGYELFTRLHDLEELNIDNNRAKLLDMIEELFFLAPKNQDQYTSVEEPERIISLQGETQEWLNQLKDRAEKGGSNKDLLSHWNGFLKKIDLNFEEKNLIEGEEIDNLKTETNLEAMQQFLWEKSYKNNIKGTYYKTYKELFSPDLSFDEAHFFFKGRNSWGVNCWAIK